MIRRRSANAARSSPSDAAEVSVADTEFADAVSADDRTAAVWAWRFVALGVIARLVRFLLRFPLWGDESFLALNIINRDYDGLTRGLDTTQIAPIGYLWWEKALVDTLGVSEFSLRGAALVSGIAALVLFRLLAGRLLRGTALIAAVGVMAVAFYPFRHSAEVKPYAGDLFAAVLLLWTAVEQRRRPAGALGMLGIAAAVLVALPLSYPAVFVAGGISIALLPEVYQRRSPRLWLGYAAFNLAILGMFALTYWLAMRDQLALTGARMQWHWREGFPPPLAEPLQLLWWLLAAHTGEVLAYPIGGDAPSCLPQAVWAVVGGVVLWRGRRRWLTVAVLGMLGLALTACLLGRYPYGYGERVQQHWVPAVCLLMGVGYERSAAWIRSPVVRRRCVRLGGAFLLALGFAWPIMDAAKPYKARFDQEHQQFSRWFWQFAGEGEPLVCVSRDLGVRLFDPFEEITYQTNQAIYRRDAALIGRSDRLGLLPAGKPIRCVAFAYADSKPDEAQLRRWLAAMDAEYRLVEERRYPLMIDHRPGQAVAYRVWRFEPRSRTAHPSRIAERPAADVPHLRR